MDVPVLLFAVWLPMAACAPKRECAINHANTPGRNLCRMRGAKLMKRVYTASQGEVFEKKAGPSVLETEAQSVCNDNLEQMGDEL